mmetsp:Transcript_8637/g.32146  ORF Transcript_8637/g.32146 Transcript_8637/m.32146 type:complete len:239 (-) Transcript_8637:128-844(-)
MSRARDIQSLLEFTLHLKRALERGANILSLVFNAFNVALRPLGVFVPLARRARRILAHFTNIPLVPLPRLLPRAFTIQHRTFQRHHNLPHRAQLLFQRLAPRSRVSFDILGASSLALHLHPHLRLHLLKPRNRPIFAVTIDVMLTMFTIPTPTNAPTDALARAFAHLSHLARDAFARHRARRLKTLPMPPRPHPRPRQIARATRVRPVPLARRHHPRRRRRTRRHLYRRLALETMDND